MRVPTVCSGVVIVVSGSDTFENVDSSNDFDLAERWSGYRFQSQKSHEFSRSVEPPNYFDFMFEPDSWTGTSSKSVYFKMNSRIKSSSCHNKTECQDIFYYDIPMRFKHQIWLLTTIFYLYTIVLAIPNAAKNEQPANQNIRKNLLFS